MSRFSSRLTSGRSSTPRTRLKIAALPPMPRARVSTTVMVRPLARPSDRAANFRSFRNARAVSCMRIAVSSLMARCTGKIADRADLDGGREGTAEELAGDGDGLIQVVGFEQRVSAQLLAGFGERAVGHQALPIL